MSTLTVSKRQGDLLTNDKALPKNLFQIKEGNSLIFIKEFLKDHPLTIGFSNELDIQNNVPTNEDVTFDFGSITLDTQQETDAIKAITEFQIIVDASEQIGDEFTSENINELILPDFCDMRDQMKNLYDLNGFDSFSVGEKRILIADWLIPTNNEVKTIFQGLVKRSEIYRLFGQKVSSLFNLEMIKFIETLAENEDGDRFNSILKRLIHPGSIDLREIL